jgi:hypothetical protein
MLSVSPKPVEGGEDWSETGFFSGHYLKYKHDVPRNEI